MITQRDLELLRPWTKSSYSNGGDNCLEYAPTTGGQVAIRHSRYPDLPPQLYPRTAWIAFLASVKDGEFGPVD